MRKKKQETKLAEFVDPLEVIDSRRHVTDSLRNLLAGRPAFLVCGGPSGKDMLPRLNRRGVFSLAVNNSAGACRPQAFVFSDPPMKFSHSIWQDPGVMKFCPTPKMLRSRNMLREKVGGAFRKSALTVVDCPNVWGFRRESFLRPDDDSFFESPGACWGNLDAGTRQTGEEKTVCTMLIGIRLLAYLGASRIHMIGVDFRMTPQAGYSFGQARDKGACESNNRQFRVVGDWLDRMQRNGIFARRGVEIYNCCENSGLRAFPYVPFDDALADVVGIVEEEPDLGQWYEKMRCPSCKSWHVRPSSGGFDCLDCGFLYKEPVEEESSVPV